MIPPLINTASGLVVNLLEPTMDQIRLPDIAEGLSKLCRYTGQCKEFYSVAQHSVMVSAMVHPKFAMSALMHDASEAYLGDVSTPLKQMMPDYRLLEARFDHAIAAAFNLPYPLPQEVRDADRRALTWEVQVLFDKPWIECKDEVRIVKMLSPREAKLVFLGRYWELHNYAA